MPDIQVADKRIYPKDEVTYGTDSTPTAAERVRTRDLSVKVYDGSSQQQAYDGDGGRLHSSVNTNPHTSMSCKVDFAGSGTIDLETNYAALLRCCGINVVENALTDVTYTPITGPITDSDSIYFVRDEGAGVALTKTLGVRGEVGLELSKGGIPFWNFSKLIGSYIQPAYNATPMAGTPTAQVKGIPVTNDNTPVCTLDSTAICLESFMLDNVGHTVEYFNGPNCLETKSQPVPVTGSIRFKDEGFNTKNWIAVAESHQGVTEIPFNAQHGTVSGSILTIAISALQITDINEADINGLKGWEAKFTALATPVITQT